MVMAKKAMSSTKKLGYCSLLLRRTVCSNSKKEIVSLQMYAVA